MLSNQMLCFSCKSTIPPDSYKLVKNHSQSDYDDEIECPNCKMLNSVYLAKGRCVDK